MSKEENVNLADYTLKEKELILKPLMENTLLL
jgi:hypothetical protein